MSASGRLAIAALVCLATLAAVRPAAAEDAATRAAKRHYVKGDKLFTLGKFEQALAEFEAAYQSKPIPSLLFNIGQAHRNLDHYEQAIFAYRKYLNLVPDADNREAVLVLIEELEAKQEALEREERERLAALDRERDRERDREKKRRAGDKPIYARWWFWGGIAAVAGASVGAYLIVTDDGIPSTDLGNVVFD